MRVFLKFFEQGETYKAMRSTFIVLIPKKDGASSMGDYRPINLVGSLYKIISKVLSVRIKDVMGEVVSSTQSVFIHGRQISNNILIANECDRKEEVMCKLDMENAYDKVD